MRVKSFTRVTPIACPVFDNRTTNVIWRQASRVSKIITGPLDFVKGIGKTVMSAYNKYESVKFD